MQIKGAFISIAMSWIRQILKEWYSPSVPPITVKSSLATKTWRPSISPYPVTTPSPGTLLLSRSKSSILDSRKPSTSTKVPGSSSTSILSRAVIFPMACCLSIRFCPPPKSAFALLLSRSLIASFQFITPPAFLSSIFLFRQYIFLLSQML